MFKPLKFYLYGNAGTRPNAFLYECIYRRRRCKNKWSPMTLINSVLPRLHFCAIVPQNFEYDAAKTVPAGHLAHIDFGLSQDFESVGCVENSHAKNNIVFHRNSRSCNGYFDWCIGFLNCTGTSVQSGCPPLLRNKIP